MAKKNKPIGGTVRSLCYIVLYLAAIAVIYPMILMLMNSIKDISDFTYSSIGFPKKLDFSTYPRAFMKAKFYYALPNSIYVAILSLLLLVGLGSAAAYPIARIKLKMNQIVFRIFMVAMIVPVQIIAVPLFGLLRKAHLVNNLSAVSLIFFVTLLPLALFVYVGSMKGIPKEIEEAAIVDGCGPWRIFFNMIFPLSKSTTATVIILTSLDIWNNFFYPLIFLSKTSKSTLSVAIFAFKNFETVKWPDMFAGMTMIVLPILIAYVLLQKQIIRGMVSGAVKG